MSSFFKQTQIRKYARIAKGELRRAVENAHNRRTLSRWDKSIIDDVVDTGGRSVSCKARVKWGRALAEKVATEFCSESNSHHNQPIWFVTLCDISCRTSIHDRAPDLTQFKSYLTKELRRHSYLGAIEPAYYTNIHSGSRIAAKKCVLWHLHVILWGIQREAAIQLFRNLETSGYYRSIAPTMPGVKGKVVKQGTLENIVGYCFKPPANAYRLSRMDCEGGIPGTMFMQGKSSLRGGERIRLFHAMKNVSLSELAVAGGKGVPLLASIRKLMSVK